MSILTINPKALKVFQNLKKFLGEENVRHWDKKINPSPSPVSDHERLYLTLPDGLINAGGFAYIDLLDGYKIIKKGVKRDAANILNEIKAIIKA